MAVGHVQSALIPIKAIQQVGGAGGPPRLHAVARKGSQRVVAPRVLPAVVRLFSALVGVLAALRLGVHLESAVAHAFKRTSSIAASRVSVARVRAIRALVDILAHLRIRVVVEVAYIARAGK